MISLIEKTNKYIDNLNEDGINKLTDNKISIYSLSLEKKKKIICESINLNYYNHRERREMIENEIKIEDVQSYIQKNPSDRKINGFQLYIFSKFCHSDKISNCLKQFGIRDMYQNHFIDLEYMEDVLFKIIQSGTLINYAKLIYMIEVEYNRRILKDFLEYFIVTKRVAKYDGRENVYDLEIQINKIQRKKKYASQKPQKMNEFESLMLGLDGINSEIDILKLTKELLSEKNRKEFKKLFKSFLDPIVENKGRANVIKIFKNYFHIVFENNLNGLLTEKTFEIENDINEDFSGTYRGNYMNYYRATIKTLVGI